MSAVQHLPHQLPPELPDIAYHVKALDSVAAIVDRVHTVHAALTDPKWYEPRLAKFFGGNSWNHAASSRLAVGSKRLRDERIVAELAQTVHQQRTTTVVEIGAGQSLGKLSPGDCYGCPWLSRSIQIALGDRVVLMTTDRLPATLESDSPDNIFVVNHQDGELSIRDGQTVNPPVNTDLEQRVFGLHAVGGTHFDYRSFHVRNVFNGQKFDFIFGRMLENSGSVDTVRQSLTSTLTRSGKYLLAVDDCYFIEGGTLTSSPTTIFLPSTSHASWSL